MAVRQRTKKKQVDPAQVLSGKKSSHSSLDALDFAVENPDALTSREALDVYIDNLLDKNPSDVKQEVLLAYMTGKGTEVSEDILRLKDALRSRRKWETKAQEAGQILDAISSMGLNNLEIAYLVELQNYVSGKLTACVSEKLGIESKISSLLEPITRDPLFQDMTRMYSHLSKEEVINNKVLEIGNLLSSDSAWDNKKTKALKVLNKIDPAELYAQDIDFLSTAMEYVAQNMPSEGKENRVRIEIYTGLRDFIQKDEVSRRRYSKKRLATIVPDKADIADTVPKKKPQSSRTLVSVPSQEYEVLPALPEQAPEDIVELEKKIIKVLEEEERKQHPPVAPIKPAEPQRPLTDIELLMLEQEKRQESLYDATKEALSSAYQKICEYLTSCKNAFSKPDYSKVRRKALVTAAFLVPATLALASVGAMRDEKKIDLSTVKGPPVIIVEPPEPAPKPVAKKVKSAEDIAFECWEDLMGDRENVGRRSGRRKLSVAKLEELTEKCFLKQAMMVDPELAKNYHPAKLENTGLFPLDVTVNTVSFKNNEGKIDYLTFFDPLGYIEEKGFVGSRIISVYNDPRSELSPLKSAGREYCPPDAIAVRHMSFSVDDEGYYDGGVEPVGPDPVVVATEAKPQEPPQTDKPVQPAQASPQPTAQPAAQVAKPLPPATKPALTELDLIDPFADEPAQKAPSPVAPAPAVAPTDGPVAAPVTAQVKPKPRQQAQEQLKCYARHKGLDLIAADATYKDLYKSRPVFYAIAPGRVTRMTKGAPKAGNFIEVLHPNGMRSQYMHLDAFSPRLEQIFEENSNGSNTVLFRDDEGPVVLPYVFAKHFDEDYSGGIVGSTGNAGWRAPHIHAYLSHRGNKIDPASVFPIENRVRGQGTYNEMHERTLVDFARRIGIDPIVLSAIRGQESNNMNDVSHAGAVGYMQVMKCSVSTARQQAYLEREYFKQKREEVARTRAGEPGLEAILGNIDDDIKNFDNLYTTLSSDDAWYYVRTDPLVNIETGILIYKYLYNKVGQDHRKAITSYNWGIGNVNSAVSRAERSGRDWFTYVPVKVQRYVNGALKSLEKKPEPVVEATPTPPRKG